MSEIKSALNDLNFLDVQFDMQFDRIAGLYGKRHRCAGVSHIN